MERRAAQIIKRPIINEKTTMLSGMNKYVFEVSKDANKIEIARAIEELIKELYPKNKSTVVSVNTAPIRDRLRRSRRTTPTPRDGKKAIVTIEGDALELFSA